jgi:hypothetical protein
MRMYLEIQIMNAVHRFVMKDRDDALAHLERLQVYVGRPRFSRNDDEPRNIKISSVDGEAIITTEAIYAARITDYDVFEEHDEQMRQARYRDARKIDLELIEKMKIREADDEIARRAER